MSYQWQLLQANLPNNTEEIIDWLLANRKVVQTEKFLNPTHPTQLSPVEVGIKPENLLIAVKRLRQAIKNQERVVIFGDYDVDGVSATAIAWEALKEAGLVTKPFIPHRLKHGYGLSTKALAEIISHDSGEPKPDLILTVDNGIVAYEALEYLAHLKIDVIVTDHHQPDTKPIQALTTVHTTKLCGSGVAWFLAHALLPKSADQWLDLAAIATIADQMPLTEANRSFVVAGIAMMKQKVARPGLKALFSLAGVQPQLITAEQLSFSLIPRLNAMGRVADGVDSLRLLCVRSSDRAEALAATLQATNLTRQELTFDMLKEAQLQAEAQSEQNILIVSSENFHEGVIGLLAGKLAEKFYKPVIAIQIGPAVAKASVRSVPGVNIIEFLRIKKALFWELGGHELAAGFACDPKKVPEIQAELIGAGKIQINSDQLVPKILIDCQLPTKLISLETLDALKVLQPFGQANPSPSFLVSQVLIEQMDIIGKNRQHVKFKLNLSGQQSFTGLAWSKLAWTEQLVLGQQVDLVVQLEENVWRNQRQLQLILIDWK